MAEENEGKRNPAPISRRGFIATAIAATAAALGLNAAKEATTSTVSGESRATQEPLVNPDNLLNDPKVPFQQYKIADTPEVRQSGGVTVRLNPYGNDPGEKDLAEEKLQPGAVLTGKFWVGGSSIDARGTKGTYIISKRADGKVIYIPASFTELVIDKSPSSASSPLPGVKP